MRLIDELRRRNVLRVGSAYVVGAWLVAQVAEFLTETFAAPLWVLQSIVVALSVATVPVLVLTWMFEFTPQGLRRQVELDRAGVVAARSGRRLDYLIALMLVAAAGWLAVSWSERMRSREQATATEAAEAQAPGTGAAQTAAAPNSIAVLPFLDLSRSGDSDVLADGLAEELLGVLGRNRELRVTARSSAFQFKGQNRDLREVGRLLGVRYVLEGSVRLAAERVRIGAQLVDAANGVQLWSETYDRTLSDLFALQEDISAQVANALRIVVTATGSTPATSGTASVEAHMELLRALQVGSSRAVVDLDRAIAHLRRALVLDPDYAAAHVELAYAIHTRALQLDETEGVEAVMGPLLERALQLNPRSGEALVLRALTTRDPAQAEQRIREGLALAPSHARGYEMLAGIVGQDRARGDEALALLEQAIALDPLSPRNHQMKGILSWQVNGDLVSAEPHFLRAFELEPRFRMALMHLAMINMTRGDFAAAIDFGERALAVDPSPMFRAGLVHHNLNIGDPDGAARVQAPDALGSTLEILVFRGEIESARALVEATPPERLPRDGVTPVIGIALRDARVNGNWERNLELAQQVLGYDGMLPADLEAFGFNHAQLAFLMRGAGALERAETLERQLAERVERDAARSPAWMQGPFDLTRAMLHALAGRRDAALAALERAFRPARPYWWCLLDGNPMFEPLREEPRYRALRARLETHLAAQRALLAQRRTAAESAPARPAG